MSVEKKRQRKKKKGDKIKPQIVQSTRLPKSDKEDINKTMESNKL